MSITRRALLGLAGAAAAIGLVGLSQREARAANMSPREDLQRRNLPNVTLTTHDGEEVRFYDDLVKDKFVTINMMYTSCPATCPLITANLVRVHQLLGDRVGRDLHMYSITLDPKTDTPKVLKEYAETHGVGKGWKLLTGKPKDIELLRRALGFAWADKEFDKELDSHTANLRYGNEPNMVWGMVPALAEPGWVKQCVLFADWPKEAAKA
jgi:protein SCO1